jgi:hypothetical protein
VITFLVRISLFASSFAIAFLLVGIRLAGRDDRLALWFFAAGLATVVPAALVVAYTSRAVGFSGTVQSAEQQGESIAGYLVGYLLPVIIAEPRATSDVIAIAVFLIILSLTYAATDLHYLNPLLPLFGFRVWHVVVDAAGTSHDFTAIGWRVEPKLNASICVIGDGAVRWVKVKGRCG